MAWRALGGALPRSHTGGVTAEDLTAVEGLIEHLAHVAHPIRSDWQALGLLIDDAAHNTEIARLYVAVEATRQWCQEDDLKTRRVEWSDSVAALQDNSDRLARDRIVHELSNTGPRSAWEPLAQLLEDALNSGDIGRLRIASVALKVWQERWWEWWQNPAECCLATLKSVHS